MFAFKDRADWAGHRQSSEKVSRVPSLKIEWIGVGPLQGWQQKNGMRYWLDARGEKGLEQGRARELNYCCCPTCPAVVPGSDGGLRGCFGPGRKAHGRMTRQWPWLLHLRLEGKEE